MDNYSIRRGCPTLTVYVTVSERLERMISDSGLVVSRMTGRKSNQYPSCIVQEIMLFLWRFGSIDNMDESSPGWWRERETERGKGEMGETERGKGEMGEKGALNINYSFLALGIFV